MPSERSIQRDEVQSSVLAAVRALLRELGSVEAAERATLASSLERDLGLGSLERVELLVRLERALGTRLPESGPQSAATPADWVRIALDAKGGVASDARWPIQQPSREAYDPPAGALSFSEVLRAQVDRDPARVHVHLLDRDTGQDISHGQLYEQASQIAAGLAGSGLQRGETVAIMLPTCADFFASFLGIMLAGGIAVPVYPPTRPHQIASYIRRQALILRNAGVRFLISFDRVSAVASVLDGQLPSLREVVSAAELAGRGRHSPFPERDPSETFFIQYTSGSTGDPKGVTLTHANVLANIRGIGHAVEARPSDFVVTWLPLYHDMGLIGSWLFSLYHGYPITVLSPLDFLVRPERWLWALSDSGGSLCPAPNFAFELCMRKIADEALDGVDLARWRVAINAGEPVLPATLRRFAQRFGPWGFDRRSFMPFYGLAESSVALTYPPFWRGPLVDRIDRLAFEAEGRAVPCAGEDSDMLEFVGNGRPLPGHEIRVAGEDGKAVRDRVRGRILFRGPSRTDGYFRNPEATAAVMDAEGWLDSGDLGYLADGELYVTGRLKDCIIKEGRNIIPQDVEMAAWEVEGVRKGCVAAFGCIDAATGTERMVVVAETRVTDRARRRRMRSGIVETVADKIGIPPDDVKLAHPGFIPKTSSGKIRRSSTCALYEKGAIAGSQTSLPWLGLAKVWAAGKFHGSLRGASALAARSRHAATGALGTGAALAFGLAARLAPTPSAARHVIAPGARIAARLAGARARGRLNGSEAAVLLAARAHRLDPLLMAASCASPFVFADRAAFAGLEPAHAFLLEPLVAAPVASGAVPVGGTLLDRMQAALDAGRTVVSFADNPVGEPPERTRFRSETFEAAATAGAAAVPVLLPDGRNGSSQLVAGEPLPGAALRAGLAEGREAARAALRLAAARQGE